jgi:hypothetical protein
MSWKRPTVSLTFSGLLVAVCAVGPACSLVLPTDTAQCSADVDCGVRGPEWKGYVCTPQKVCAKPTDYCETDRQCIDFNAGKPFVCDLSVNKCVIGCTEDKICTDANPGKPFVCDLAAKVCRPGCADDKICTDNNPGKMVVCGADPANPTGPKQCVDGCQTNSQCIDANPGKYIVCRQDKRKCVPLTIPTECPQVFAGSAMPSGAGSPVDDLRDDSTYLVGLVCSQGGAAGQLGPPCIEAAELAREDFMKAGGGLPMGAKRRPIAFVNCDNNGDVVTALAHLVDTVGVKAIIGPSNSGVVSTNGPAELQANEVVSVTGAGGGVKIDILKGSNGFLWRTQPGDDLVVAAIPLFLTDTLEPQLRVNLGIAAGTPIRVAVATTTDAVGSGYANFLQANLHFNGGLSAVDNAANNNFKLINYGDPAADPDTAAKQAKAAQDLLAFAPHIVIFGGRGETQTGITKPVEDGWDAVTYPSFRPYYIYRPPVFAGSGATFIDKTVDPVAKESLRKRSIGLTPTSKNKVLNANYQLRHHAQWDGFVHTNLPPFPGTTVAPSSVGPSITAQGFYDATYTVLSALIATRKTDPTGREISQAIAKTQPGAGAIAIDVGPVNVAQLQQVLSSGGSVDLNGVLSDLNFIDNTVLSNAAVYCFKKASAAGKTPSPVESGYEFDTVAKTFSGTPPTNLVFANCP